MREPKGASPKRPASDGSLIPLPGPSPASGEGGSSAAGGNGKPLGGPALFVLRSDLWPLVLGSLLLLALWLGPLPERARGSFSAHMIMHMGIVAVAAPLLALGLTRRFGARLPAMPPGFALLATFVEMVIVWGWHAPALHDAARVDLRVTLVEQGSFLLAGLLVWAAAFGGAGRAGRAPKLAGAGALLLTSMHMTLLGALLLFAPRPLYACATLCAPLSALTPLQDQAAGGAIMLSLGGLAYLLGGLALVGRLLRDEPAKGAAA